jgi:hypothetical protein
MIDYTKLVKISEIILPIKEFYDTKGKSNIQIIIINDHNLKQTSIKGAKVPDVKTVEPVKKPKAPAKKKPKIVGIAKIDDNTFMKNILDNIGKEETKPLLDIDNIKFAAPEDLMDGVPFLQKSAKKRTLEQPEICKPEQKLHHETERSIKWGRQNTLSGLWKKKKD